MAKVKRKPGRPPAKVKRERLVVVLPPALREWVAVKAAREREEMSRIVERALVLLRAQEKGRE